MMSVTKGSKFFQIVSKPERYNGSLITGDIGSGKTFALSNVIIPENIRRGNKVVILDTTGSFDDDELKKCKFPIRDDEIYKINLCEEKFCIGLSMVQNTDTALARKWSDMLCNSLDIDGEIQTKLLDYASSSLMSNHSNPSMLQFVSELESLYIQCASYYRNEMKNCISLFRRLSSFIRNDFFELSLYESSFITDKEVILIQLGGVEDDISKRECGNIILYELWNLVKEKAFGNVCLIIDEFQSFSLHRGSILERMIRLERKHGLSVALATQYLTDRDPEEMAVVDMIETKLYFKPPDRDIKTLANIIDKDNSCIWMDILKNLTVGHAVLTGRYEINGNIATKPLVVNIKAENENRNNINAQPISNNTMKRKKMIMIGCSQDTQSGTKY